MSLLRNRLMGANLEPGTVKLDCQPIDTRPELRSARLWLRPFHLSDSARLSTIINDREIAANTCTIEYPFPAGAAEKWIEPQPQMWLAGKSSVFAICLRETEELIGAIGLQIDQDHHQAVLGYWIANPFRNQGYATEAARTVIGFGFEKLGLHKICASSYARNPASGKVMEKVGMQLEGYFRGHFRKWGVFEDVIYFGILASDWNRLHPSEK
jgi:[ribosomal protein S5]-alanine N-acetyltransferase